MQVNLSGSNVPESESIPMHIGNDNFQLGKGIINNGKSVPTFSSFSVSIPANTTSSTEFVVARPPAGKAWIITTISMYTTGSAETTITAASRIDGTALNRSVAANASDTDHNLITYWGAPGLPCIDGIYLTCKNVNVSAAQNANINIRYHEVTLA